jgi:F-type H+-transporting ATPase subunit epsilon
MKMENNHMHLKVLLPYKVFADVKNVTKVVVETNEGSYGFLPNRLDAVVALMPGIFTYQTKGGSEQIIAINEGIFVKEGLKIMVSVRNAVGGTDLGKLHELIEKEFEKLDESERVGRSIAAKLESGFMQSLEKFRRE